MRVPVPAWLGALLFAFVVVARIGAATAQTCATESFTSDPAKNDGNPLRGFMSYSPETGNNFWSTLEYQYIGFAQLMTGVNTFNWAPLETQLAGSASRGKQLVFRVYIDYPGDSYSMPAFLSGVSSTAYNDYGGGNSPDYSNENLISALESLIAAMGQEYDGDNRIGFIMIGMLGFWGEWHTYPHTSYMASTATMTRILDAFDDAFAVTQLVVSADQLMYAAPDLRTYTIGWHDDDFGASTCTESYGFQNRLANNNAADRVNFVSFGGEVQPDVQQVVFDSDAAANTFAQCVADVKVSWLLYYDLFNVGTAMNADRVRAAVKVREMGYQFYLTAINVLTGITCNQAGKRCATVVLSIRNMGNAPFYYDIFAHVTIDGTEFASSSLKGFLPAATPQDFEVEVNWDSGLTGDIPAKISLGSDHVIIPIKWAVAEADSNGDINIDVPSTCGSSPNTMSTSSTATTSQGNTGTGTSQANTGTTTQENTGATEVSTDDSSGDQESGAPVFQFLSTVLAMALVV